MVRDGRTTGLAIILLQSLWCCLDGPAYRRSIGDFTSEPVMLRNGRLIDGIVFLLPSHWCCTMAGLEGNWRFYVVNPWVRQL